MINSSSTNPTAWPFRLMPGCNHLDAAKWLKQLRAFAFESQPNGRQHGLLGLTMPEAEYALRLLPNGNPPDPFVLLHRDPGGFPAGGTAAAREAFLHNTSEVEIEQKAVRKLRTAALHSIDSSLVAALEDQMTGLGDVSLIDIIDHVNVNFGVIASEQFNDMKRYFQGAMRPGKSMQEVVAEHELFHTVALNAGSALSQHDKVTNLLCAVKGASAYDFTVNTFKHTFPTMQQQTFANLKAALITASRSIEVGSASVGLSAMDAGHSAAFGAAGADATSSAPTGHVPAATSAAAAASSATPAEMSNAAHGAARKAPTKYCWYHGRCNHSSADCDLKDEISSFKTAATEKNRMGGAVGDWPDIKKAILDSGKKIVSSTKRNQGGKKSA
jgi:hypothetical protein